MIWKKKIEEQEPKTTIVENAKPQLTPEERIELYKWLYPNLSKEYQQPKVKEPLPESIYSIITGPFRKENRLPWDLIEIGEGVYYVLVNIADGCQTANMPNDWIRQRPDGSLYIKRWESNSLLNRWWGTSHPSGRQVRISKTVIGALELWFWGDKVPYWVDKHLDIDGHKTRKAILLGLDFFYTGIVSHNHKVMGFYFNHTF